MDFSSLTRKELQALCKKNKLPANLTNVAMADSLKALDKVEGLEEFLNQSKSDPQQSPEKTMNGSLSIPRTAGRTSTRRKPIQVEPESSQPLTQSRRGTRRAVSDEMDQEKTEVPKTPAAPNTRRRAPAASARQNTTQKENPSVQSVYNTRRSVRLLEKNMAKLSLDYENSMSFKMDELSTEINNGSEKSDGSVDMGSNMQTVSEASSERVDVSEVSSEPKSNGPLENEGKLQDDVQEPNKTDMIKVEDDSKVKSEVESGVFEPKSASDVIVDVSHEEGSDETDDKEPHDEGTEKSIAAKVSDDISVEVMCNANAAQSSLLQEVNESLSAEESTDPNSLTLSSTHDPAQNPEDKCRSLEIKESETNAAEDQDFDSKSAPVGETGEVKDVTNVEGAAKPQVLTLSLSDERQSMISSKDSIMYGAEGDYKEKFNFESDFSSEEDSGDDISEDETMNEKSIECEDKKKDDMQVSEGGDISSENSVAECLVDANASAVAEVATATQFSPLSDEIPKSMKLAVAQEAMPVEEVSMVTNDHEGTPKLPLAAADLLPLQFPRPTLSKSGKSPGKKQSAILNYIFDDNEEKDIESGDKTLELGGVEMKRDTDTVQKELDTKSLRQLKKMLKNQLNIGDSKNGTKMVEKPRIALQEVPENQMAVNKAGNGN
ncbi:microtubule-associated protein futsch [Prunus yedoensis var. nudiflora]|uniref:Microtubule-associated protein futsch n=1 Tax=Prunus yedoensis var. nudiflora TaxID=2094558 RepID=A0A314UWR1_PRUYE|nr:microtubule-associated protein futsch [Prunus yedoensis var. nudiflora]